jgi:hypothetical protein
MGYGDIPLSTYTYEISGNAIYSMDWRGADFQKIHDMSISANKAAA